MIKQKPQDKNQESALSKAVKDRLVRHSLSILLVCSRRCTRSDKIASEAQHGLIAQVLKDIIFSSRLGASSAIASANAGDIVDTAMSIG